MLLEKFGITEVEIPKFLKGERVFAFELFMEILTKSIIEKKEEFGGSLPFSQWIFLVSNDIIHFSKRSKSERKLIDAFSKRVWNFSNPKREECSINNYGIIPESISLIFFKDKRSAFNNFLMIFTAGIAVIRRIKKRDDLNHDHAELLITKQMMIIFTSLLILSRVKPRNFWDRRRILKIVAIVEKELGYNEPLIVDACELAGQEL